jgi:hypothetical protein
MNLIREAVLLFSLNLLDALLTIVWVRNGAAEEANTLMAVLLDIGDLPFLGTKLAIGMVAAVAFVSGSHTNFARYGISFAIAIYLSLIGIHVITGLAALGFLSHLI